MTSSSKDRGNTGREDCQIHVDKEGESCVIKIESVGQEKMLKELLARFNSLKTEVNQLLSSGQQQPKEMIEDMTAKLKPLEDQLQQMNKHVGDDHIQLNKKFDEIKQDLNSFKDQQKNIGSSKDAMEKILQKLDNLDKILRNSQDEGQKRLSSDLQNLKQQIPSKNDFKPVLDAIQALQTSFDKEKTKPDILARKLDSIDQKLKESHPEQIAAIKDIQTKIDPLHKATPQTSETLTKINDRVKAMHADTVKPHPDVIQKLDNIDQQLKNQQNSLLEPIKQILNDKLNPIIEQQIQTKKAGEEKLGSIERDSDSPNRVPLCINGLIPVPSNSQVLQALASDIAKKLTDIQTKFSSSDEFKRKQDDLIGNFAKQQAPLIDEIKRLIPILDKLKQQQQKDSENLNDLIKQQDLLKNIDSKLNQILNDSPKQSDNNQDMEKALQPFSQIIKTLKDSIEVQQQNDNKKLDNLEQHLSKTLDITPKLNEITSNLKQTDPTMKKLSNDLEIIKTLIEKQITPDEILLKINEINQKQKAPIEAALKDIHSKASKDSLDIKKKNDDIANKIDKLIDPLNKVNEQIRYLSDKIDRKSSTDLTDAFKKFEDQLNYLNKNLPAMGDIPKQIGSLKDAFDKFKQNENNNDTIKDINNRLKNLDETIKGLSDQSRRLDHDNEKNNTSNLRQVPLSQSVQPKDSNNLMSTSENQTTNLFTNLLTLQTTIRNSDNVPYQDIQPYLKRIEQSTLVQTNSDLQRLIKRINELCLNNNSNTQNPDFNKNSINRTGSLRHNTSIQQYSETTDNSENRKNANKISLPPGYLTKSRYISLLSEQTIRDHWPKLSQRSTSIIDAIVNQPLEFDHGTNLDRLIKQNGLEQYALLTRNAIEKSDKDYDKISYMMDSIVFDQMTMIGSREALIRPWNPSLLNRTSSKGFYPYPSGNNREIERFKVNKDISLWMVETDESKPYFPTEFMPNIGRLNEKYERIQHPQFNEIRQKRREDETRWNERYAFTKDNRTILFVNDLRSYFMDYDTKRKYQVHDDVPINPVCRTGIAGRGDLPFWGPNHCVVVILLRNINDPEVVLMRHHDNALVLPKGFYGHEARYDNQIKIIQDPVSGQILPPNLLDYWWSNIIKLNEMNNSLNNLKRILNDKELKEEFAEIFSQKGCNKSVFDNGYVDHPLNTDHAWIESSVWKIQFKDWRIPEMKSAKYAIADDFKSNNSFPFVWMKLTDAILIVPSFDRGILVDVLATGMPL